jgi:hypothetical protein
LGVSNRGIKFPERTLFDRPNPTSLSAANQNKDRDDSRTDRKNENIGRSHTLSKRSTPAQVPFAVSTFFDNEEQKGYILQDKFF